MIYTNNAFDGFYPVGTAAIVQANTPEQAADLLNESLVSHRLKPTAKPEDMEPFPSTMREEPVRILCDGNY